MMKTIIIVIVFCIYAIVASAQNGNTVTTQGAGAPTGSCSPIQRYIDTTNSNLYFCAGGTWHQGNGGGTGTTAANTIPVANGTATSFISSPLTVSGTSVRGSGNVQGSLLDTGGAFLDCESSVYGAVGNNIADDTTALQTCFDAAMNASMCARLHTGHTYKTTAPLRLWYSGRVCVSNNPSGQSVYPFISPSGYSGPAIYLAGAVSQGFGAIPTSSALLTGAGSSYVLDGVGGGRHHWFDFRDQGSVELDTLNQLSVQAEINLTAVVPGDGYYYALSSRGQLNPSGAADEAFGFFGNGFNQQWCFNVNVGGSTKTPCGAASAITTGLHNIEMSKDASFCRLFIDGVMDAAGKIACSGNVVQKWYEQVIAGPYLSRVFDFGFTQDSMSAKIGPIRISNIARHTSDSSFTPPTSTYTVDANTLLLVNDFSPVSISGSVDHAIIQATSASSGAIYFQMHRDIDQNPGMTTSKIEYLGMAGGIFATKCDTCSLRHIWNNLGQYGFWGLNNLYDTQWEDWSVTPSTGARTTQMMIGQQSGGNSKVTGLNGNINGSMGLFVLDAGITIDRFYGTACPNTKYEIILSDNASNSNVLITNPSFSNECPSGATSLVAAVGDFGFKNVKIDGGTSETSGNASGGYVLEVDGAGTCEISNLNTPNIGLGMVKVTSAPTVPCRISNWIPGGAVGSAAASVQNTTTAIQVPTFSATPTWDASLFSAFETTLTANVTSSTLSNPSGGQTLTFFDVQNGSGGFTKVWPSTVKGAPTIDTGANDINVSEYRFDGTNALLNTIPFVMDSSYNPFRASLYYEGVGTANYGRLTFNAKGSGGVQILSERGGSASGKDFYITNSTGGDLKIEVAAGQNIKLRLNNGDVWSAGTSAFGPDSANGTLDLCGSSTRCRDLWLARNLRVARVFPDQGTASVSGKFVLSGGWGSTASQATLKGGDQASCTTITSSGTGQGANPTITWTFSDGTWTQAPIIYAWQEAGTGNIADLQNTTESATAPVFTYVGTPVAASTYRICFSVWGSQN